jgi:hypothetical protein
MHDSGVGVGVRGSVCRGEQEKENLLGTITSGNWEEGIVDNKVGDANKRGEGDAGTQKLAREWY